MSDTFLLTFAVITGLSAFLAVLRRSYQDTAAGHFHKALSNWGLPEGFDEAEKLHRVSVLLDLCMNVLRTSWLLAWAVYRFNAEPWWLAEGAVWAEGADPGSIEAIGPIWIVVVVAELFAMSILVFELIPQVFSAFRGKAIALTALRLLFAIESVMTPVTRGFRAVRRALVRVVGNGPERSEADLAEETLRAAVEIGEREGLLHDRERSMIESVLEFHDAEVTEVMTPRTDMVCMRADMTVEEATPKVIECGHSRIPVYGENIDDMVGVLYVKDLLQHYQNGNGRRQQPLSEVVRKIYFVPETKKIGELLAEFRSQRFHIALILDEYGGTAGLVTIEDILEEIVGEIEDEYDDAAHKLIQKLDEQTFDIDGRAHIDDVNETLGVAIPEGEDYETVAGFLFGEMGKVPSEGDVVEHSNLQFRVTSADERKIKRLRLQVLHPQEQDLEG